ncbi:cytochrome P450 [Streptomyces sp. NPDC037389]|uniref:cytochrome P450 n=1 Tax=Streptomyces sp. NPDC037389 TaxID=3155369 RepID=UPI00340B0573
MTLDAQEDVLDWPFARTHDGCPAPVLAKLRQRPPSAIRLPAGAVGTQLAWLVTRYPDVHQALKDPRLSADELAPGAPVRLQVPPGGRPSSFLRMDDPEHSRLRGMIASEFTARRVRTMRPAIQRLVDELLDELQALPRPADLHDVFSMRLPTLVIARVLGVPDEDSEFFTDKTRGALSQGNPEESYAAFLEMTRYLEDMADRSIREPGEDLIGRLAVRAAAGEITRDEIVGIARLVLVAGHETTTNQIALSVLSMLRDSALRARVMADPGELIPRYVEESMRFWSLSQDAILRVALEDLDLGGVTVHKGEAVVISIPAANHDESVFSDPAVIDVDRDTGAHLQWGLGPHYCLGAPLARLEMELALTSLFGRLPTLELAVDEADGLFRQGTVFHGLDSLPVTW